MPSRLWMPLVGIALILILGLFMMTMSWMMTAVVFHTPFLLLPFAIGWVLFTGWLGAIVADRIGVHLDNQALRRQDLPVKKD